MERHEDSHSLSELQTLDKLDYFLRDNKMIHPPRYFLKAIPLSEALSLPYETWDLFPKSLSFQAHIFVVGFEHLNYIFQSKF